MIYTYQAASGKRDSVRKQAARLHPLPIPQRQKALAQPCARIVWVERLRLEETLIRELAVV